MQIESEWARTVFMWTLPRPRPGRFDEWGSALLGRADADLSASRVARSATEALITALAGAEVVLPGDDPPPSYFMRSAILLLAAIGLRTARACLLVIGAGYEPEAQALKRRLSEIHMRAEAIVTDPSGQHARSWLDGRGPSTPRRLANQFGNLDVWDTYSASGHADARGSTGG
jgi:hypothetical protein